MSLLKMIKAQLGLSNTPGENHFWDGSVANQLSLKRGTPDAPGAKVIDVVSGKVEFPGGRTYASGEVIQELIFTDSGGFTSSTSWTQMGGSKQITPKSTNSKLIASCSFYGYPGSYSGVNYANLYIDCESTDISGISSLGCGASAAQVYIPTIMAGVYNNTTLAVKTFKLFLANAVTPSSNGAAGNLIWTIREVQN